MDLSDRWLEAIAKRLDGGGYRTQRLVRLRDEPLIDFVASRTYFSWKGLVLISQHVVIRRMEQAGVADMAALFDAGFRLGKKRNWIPLLRGMQFGYMVLPVIITPKLQPELAEYASACPRRHWSLFQFPVVVETSTGRTEYFRDTALWGAFFFSDMRSVAERFIAAGF